jgi:hypothetical protein
MNSPIPQYIEARIRRPAPADLPIIPWSTPVVAFGDARTAKVATIGLNPSKREFLDKNGEELTGAKRRLETRSSLGVSDISAASLDVIGKVFEGCNGYFERCPFNIFFGRFKNILEPLKVAYCAGTACHLDLVQWATDPVWGKLKHDEKESLICADLPFLKEQLSQNNSPRIRLLLLNGAGIKDACCERLGCDLAEKTISCMIGWKLFVGRTPQGTKMIGWNKFLLAPPGVTNEEIKALGIAVEKEARSDLD